MTMCVPNTPIEDFSQALGLWVKREDLCCPGGPNFSKTRGVFAHIAKRPEEFIGVLDTSHSQGGWAVARACRLLGKQCVNFYPVFKGQEGRLGEVQQATRELGAQLLPLKAGRSAILYHRAKEWMANNPGGKGYMMPNALKLDESVEETAAEVARTFPAGLEHSCMPVLVSASSGTIAAGVLRGLVQLEWNGRFIVHMGYSRSESAVRAYVKKMAGLFAVEAVQIEVVDEGYSYADAARDGIAPPFTCNKFYDLKALRWWRESGQKRFGNALFWNIG